MKSRRRPTAVPNETVQLWVDRLKQVENDLDTFLDADNPDCDVDPEVRQASQLYLDTWVKSSINHVIEMMDKRLSEEWPS